MNMREAQAAESRTKLLQSARGLFAKKGYKGTAVREISRKADLADGLLYHYFPSGKKGLFRKIIEEDSRQITESFLTRQNIAYYKTLPVAEMLERIYQDFSDIVKENIDVIRILFREDEARSIIVGDEALCLIEGKVPWFMEILEYKYQAGEIREMDFESAAVSLEGVLYGRVLGLAFDLSDEGFYQSRMRFFRYVADLWKNERKGSYETAS